MTDRREFDLVLFGATGFTGLLMVRELVLSLATKEKGYDSLKWAVAGRNLQKLDSVLEKVGIELGQDLSKVPKVQADVAQVESLRAMAKRTRLVVNSVGPYKKYGKPVVEACVEAGTHHIDLSGELLFVEETQLEFDARARETGSIVISACGWESISTDIGVAYLKKHFPGLLHSVELYSTFLPGDEGYLINIGTWASAVNVVPDFIAYLRVHSRLYKEQLTTKLPVSKIAQRARILPFTVPDFAGVNVLQPSVDKPTIERTQYYEYEHYQERPAQIQTYFTLSSWRYVVKFGLIGTIMAPFILCGIGRRLLLRYPRLFSWGYASLDGPTRAQIDTTRFECRFLGKGWAREGTATSDEEPERPFDTYMTVLVSGRDPAYLATATAIIQAALTICLEEHQMPKGVLTPASAFRDTKLVERLQSRDFKFEIVNKK